jgi:hypothetical protein
MKKFTSFILIILSSCGNKKEITETPVLESTNSALYFREKLYDKKYLDNLDNLIILKGDTIAYNELKGVYFVGQQRFTGFLYYSIVMANKHKYKTAYFDVYDILTSVNKYPLDSSTLHLANSFLLKGKSISNV